MALVQLFLRGKRDSKTVERKIRICARWDGRTQNELGCDLVGARGKIVNQLIQFLKMWLARCNLAYVKKSIVLQLSLLKLHNYVLKAEAEGVEVLLSPSQGETNQE